MNSALRNLKALGELAAGNTAFGLQQQQRGEESICLHEKNLPFRTNFFILPNQL